MASSSLDRDDLDEAIEQAAFVPRAGEGSAIATAGQVDRLRGQLRRLLEELPGDVCVHDLRELLEPDAGEPDEVDDPDLFP